MGVDRFGAAGGCVASGKVIAGEGGEEGGEEDEGDGGDDGEFHFEGFLGVGVE